MSHGLVLAGAIAYLLGSIPFGLILTRFGGAGDLRAIGSGNIGATNVLRTGRKGLAAATLLLDGLKGVIAVIIAPHLALADPQMGLAVAAFAAVFGHCFPVWLNFRGGKGVATGLGVTLALSPITGAIACLVWLAVARLSRISSAGALAAFALVPFILPPITTRPYFSAVGIAVAAYTILIIARHHDNIRRLLSGEERRIKIDAPAQTHMDV